MRTIDRPFRAPLRRIAFVVITAAMLLAGAPVASAGEIINVKSFGAVGDGAADDTAAANSAFASIVDAATVVFPAGTYKISTLRAITSNNVSIVCEGSALLHTDVSGSEEPLISVIGNRFTIRDCRLTSGNDEGRTRRSGLRIAGSDAYVENVAVSGFSGVGILFEGKQKFSCVGCSANNNGYAGLDVGTDTADISIIGGTFSRNGGRNGVDGYGLTVHSSACRILGVHAEGNKTVQIDAHGVSKMLIIDGNTIRFTGDEYQNRTACGISVTGQPPRTATARDGAVGADNIVIVNNVIDGGNQSGIRAGILLTGQQASSRTLEGHLTQATVMNNTIANFHDAVALLYARPYGTKALVLVGNTLHDCPACEYALLIDPSPVSRSVAEDKRLVPDLVRIEGNTLIDVPTITVTVGATVAVVGNYWVTSAPSERQPSIVMVPTADRIGRIVVRDNELTGAPASAIQPSFSAPPRMLTWHAGDVILSSQPRSEGPYGWLCIRSGSATDFTNASSDVMSSVNNGRATIEARSLAIAKLTSITKVATALAPGHSFRNGDLIVISGAVPGGYNGTHRVEGADTSSFKFIVDHQLPATTVASVRGVFQNVQRGSFVTIPGVTFGGSPAAEVLSVDESASKMTVSRAADQDAVGEVRFARPEFVALHGSGEAERGPAVDRTGILPPPRQP